MGFLLSTLVLLLGVQGISSLWTVRKITAQSGGSVTIPCHYHRLHKDLPKLWCKGKNWLTCMVMRPTNQAKRTAISFQNSPDELVTTMTMTNLRSSDSNRYWCAVKTQSSYIRTSLELSVTEGTPDLSVASDRVSGEEGGNVTVQCLYSDKLRDTEKKWCISGDLRSCQTAQDLEPSSGSALQINDTNDGVYTVTLTGLKRTDTGWYWCTAGEVQVPVHINVDSRQLYTVADTKKPNQTSTASPKQFDSTTQSSSYPTTTENPKEGSGISSLWTVRKITAQSGGSVTIPCHYHRLHKDLPKLWCKGKNWLTCMVMRPTNQAKRTAISFQNSPDELVTTMTMTNLRSSDSNRYWCAVKTQSLFIRTSLELSVTEGTPDLSVASDRVSGEEGGNVTVQCLYSDKLRDTEKKWCISGDLRSCQTAQDLEPSSGSALQINDTNNGVYTVTLTGLKRTDTGWYWCTAGEVQVPVHINVDSRQLYTVANTKKPNQTSTASPKQFDSTTQSSSYPTTTENPKEGSGPYTYTMTTSFTSANSFDVHNHNSVATFAQTKLPESTWTETEKPVRASTASPKKFYSTTRSSSYPTSSSQSSWTVKTPLTSRSITPFLVSNSTVIVSSKNVVLEQTPINENRNFIWVIVLTCAALMLFTLLGISWKLWSRHQKANAREEVTELTTELHVNERVDLLGNEWTNTSFHTMS